MYVHVQRRLSSVGATSSHIFGSPQKLKAPSKVFKGQQGGGGQSATEKIGHACLSPMASIGGPNLVPYRLLVLLLCRPFAAKIAIYVVRARKARANFFGV